MKEEKLIQKLLGLGFEDKTYSLNNPRFELDVNGFSLCYEKWKFVLEGNGGYDYSGTLELNHLQIKDIKPLYKILTGKTLKETNVSFNYTEWHKKLKKAEDERIELYKLFPPLPSDVGFLDMLTNMTKYPATQFVWHEQEFLKK